jgi:hypothetical protein
MPAELIADVRVWRAATRFDAGELQPTGPRQLGRATRIFQEQTETGQTARHTSPALLRTHSCRNWQRLSGGCCRTLLLIADVLFEVVPGILSGTGAMTFRRKSARQGGPDNFRGMPVTCASPTYPPRGTPKGYEGGDASFFSRLTTRTCPRSLWRSNDIRRTSRIATGNPPGGTP